MSQLDQQEALTRLLMEKGVFTKEEFWEMVKVVAKKSRKWEMTKQRKTDGNAKHKD
jgi:hypothetical protein